MERELTPLELEVQTIRAELLDLQAQTRDKLAKAEAYDLELRETITRLARETARLARALRPFADCYADGRERVKSLDDWDDADPFLLTVPRLDAWRAAWRALCPPARPSPNFGDATVSLEPEKTPGSAET